MTKHYPDVNPNPDFPSVEKSVLAHWEKHGLFKRSVDNRPATIACESAGERAISPQSGASCEVQQHRAEANNEFIFYDGPPFANGLPHYGHLLTGYVKDVFARYQTMRGKKVERRFGWDCHGLPAEMGSEKELNISGRQAIQNFGIDKFNEHCRTSVMKYTREWEDYVNRQARWVDFAGGYKTMDKNFMESVLWAFKQLYDKGLVYEAYRVMPYSWAAETPLSNFETRLDNATREREDKAITVAFELNTPPKGVPKADKYYILAWTTTPWTLPSNLALAVGKEVKYVSAIGADGNCYIFSSKAFGTLGAALNLSAKISFSNGASITAADGKVAAASVGFSAETKLTETYENLWEIEFKNLVGLSYHPLFPYFASHKHAFKIIDGSSFITDGDGTGVVHIAPGFGEDDQKVAEANGIELVVPVDEKGRYTDAIFDIPSPLEGEGGTRSVSDEGSVAAGTNPSPLPSPSRGEGVFRLQGLNVIAEPGGSKFGLANDRIIDYLKASGHLIKQEQFKHNYPHCWRTDQPLIYRAMPSWYVEVTKFRDRAVEINKQINWIPEHIRDGQMAHMLATAPDWSISRNRFWGTPIPVWRAKSGKVIVIGSIEELEKLSGKKVADLHRPYIDEIIISKDGEEYKRVEDVFDCWFESGSMPFAQVHYPFENKEWFESHFPADFITEYVGQTRGWFNTLIMLSTAIFDKPPFLNCICHGIVLDSETGLKYSKRLKNYKDPMEVMDKFGADSLRWLMIASPVMRGHDLSVDPEGKFIRDVVRLAIKPIWNAYNFFTLYANADGIEAKLSADSRDVMDGYIIAKCAAAVETIKTALDAYDTPTACDAVVQFFEVLNNWYIRRNKERFWAEEKSENKQAAYDTLYTVLVTMCEAAAPLLPLTLDDIYMGLTKKESVHVANFPTFAKGDRDHALVQEMDRVQDICNAALGIRNKLNLRVRQPLAELTIIGQSRVNPGIAASITCDEINVKKLTVSTSANIEEYATLKLSINSQALGKRLPALMKQILPASKKGEWKQVGGTVEICGEKLLAGEYTLQLEPKPEYKDRAQALSTNDALVILDTTITPELEAEGIARDVVRMVQQARKDAGLHVSDRISLGIAADSKIESAVKANHPYIAEQTLASNLALSGLDSPLFTSKAEIDSMAIEISLVKAA